MRTLNRIACYLVFKRFSLDIAQLLPPAFAIYSQRNRGGLLGAEQIYLNASGHRHTPRQVRVTPFF